MWHVAVSALVSDFLCWLSGRTCGRHGHDTGGRQQADGAAAHAPPDPEAQAAAVAELKQDCANEKGRAVRLFLWAKAAVAARFRAPQATQRRSSSRHPRRSRVELKHEPVPRDIDAWCCSDRPTG